MTIEDATQSQAFARATAFAGADADFAPSTDGFYVGVAGHLKVDLAGGSAGVVFKNVPVGFHRIRASKIYNTGTTATEVWALFAK